MPLACQRLQSRQRSDGSPPNGGGCTDDQPHVHWLSTLSLAAEWRSSDAVWREGSNPAVSSETRGNLQ
jgi:hypothetical protein